MIPTPIAFGLTVCEKVIVEEGTRRLTLVNCFTKLVVERFPSPPQSFLVFAALTDGQGDATIQIAIEHADTMEEVYRQDRQAHFEDRLLETQFLFAVTNCVFAAPGRYYVVLRVDGGWAAHRRLRVVSPEVQS